MAASRADAALLALGCGVASAGVAVVFAGPEAILPVAWGLDGQVRGWATREWVGAGLLLAAIGLIAAGPALGWAASRAGDPSLWKRARLSLVVVVLGLAVFWAVASLTGATSIAGSALTAAMGLVLAAAAPWVRPASLSRLWLVLGLSGVFGAVTTPQPAGLILLAAATLAGTGWIISRGRSANSIRRDERKQSGS